MSNRTFDEWLYIEWQVLEAGLCSLYAARATNLLTRAEPMQRRVLDWGGRLSRCFGRVVKTLHYGKVSPIVRATHHQHHSLSINRTYN